eukprot:TRINITY_DN2551_c0_g1_i3.p1 TRINITY_DN2551_c0_g1~~TRINITY_DN2551_c0_g1_i3.p1  ORF type:complete len:174 (-),score=32.98 TRINITY_DN2551_c0_g1_i3:163-684(-)
MPRRRRSEKMYEVEAILGQRQRKGGSQYLIKWKGFDESYNSWEPAEHLSPDLISSFQNGSSSSKPLQRRSISKLTTKQRPVAKPPSAGYKKASLVVDLRQQSNGNFGDGDTPVRLGQCQVRTGGGAQDIEIEVFWRPRKDGYVPTPTFVNRKVLRERCPGLLLDFYEMHMSIV